MIPQIIEKSRKKIVEMCRRHQISELSLFGSRARGDFSAASDFDFLVEFLPEAEISYFELFRIQDELEELVQSKVDLVPKGGLKPFVRDFVLEEAEIIYAA